MAYIYIYIFIIIRLFSFPTLCESNGKKAITIQYDYIIHDGAFGNEMERRYKNVIKYAYMAEALSTCLST